MLQHSNPWSKATSHEHTSRTYGERADDASFNAPAVFTLSPYLQDICLHDLLHAFRTL